MIPDIVNTSGQWKTALFFLVLGIICAIIGFIIKSCVKGKTAFRTFIGDFFASTISSLAFYFSTIFVYGGVLYAYAVFVTLFGYALSYFLLKKSSLLFRKRISK